LRIRFNTAVTFFNRTHATRKFFSFVPAVIIATVSESRMTGSLLVACFTAQPAGHDMAARIKRLEADDLHVLLFYLGD